MATTKATELHQLSGTLTVDANGHVTLTGNVNAANFVKGGKQLLDSSLASALVDSSYVAARQTATNLTNYRTVTQIESMIDSNVTALIDGAPGALNTLNELAAALNDDASFLSLIHI